MAAFVLAGGKSTRMGRDKAFVEFNGKTLLVHALDLVSTVARQVGIVGDRQKFSDFGRVIEDLYPDRGPLGGIHAALASSGAAFNLILAVDLPFVETRFLKYLSTQALTSCATATVPRVAGGWQPLCAVYRREFASVAEPALIAGNNKIDLLWAKIKTRVIDQSEFSRLGFADSMFCNLNTPEELENARQTNR